MISGDQAGGKCRLRIESEVGCLLEGGKERLLLRTERCGHASALVAVLEPLFEQALDALDDDQLAAVMFRFDAR